MVRGITADGRGWSKWMVNGITYATNAYWTDNDRAGSIERYYEGRWK